MGETRQIASGKRRRPTPALVTGVVCAALAAVGLAVEPVWALVPLAGFIVVCGTAAFFPRWAFFLPIVTGGPAEAKAVALTFDDGPEPGTTGPLLELLHRRSIPATFFVVGNKVTRHPESIATMLRQGHELGNHTFSHDPLLAFRSIARVRLEVDDCQQAIMKSGVESVVFRPPAGITNPRIATVLRERELTCVGFACRATDFGNRRIKGLSARILRRVAAGDIILLHDGNVADQCGPEGWLAEIEQLLDGLRERGLEVVPLSRLLGRPVMK